MESFLGSRRGLPFVASLTALIIEEDLPTRRLLRKTLCLQGFRVVEVATPAEGLQQAERRRPDIVLLDLQPHNKGAAEMIRQLREWSQVPILAITPNGRESEGAAARDAGANDYISQPFGTEDLLTRIQLTMRRAGQAGSHGFAPTSHITVGELQVDLSRRRILVSRREVHLTPIQYRLLIVLTANAGKVVPYRQLLRDIWGPTHAKHTEYLRVCMRHLRQKLEADPNRPKYLLTEPRIGYRLVAA